MIELEYNRGTEERQIRVPDIKKNRDHTIYHSSPSIRLPPIAVWNQCSRTLVRCGR